MKPILFNGEMVKAILDDRKTNTRRVIKPRSKKACGFSIVSRNDGKSNYVFEDVYDTDDEERMFDSPQSRIRVGDILYVRETWAKHTDYVTDKTLFIPDGYIYKATGEHHMGLKWRPSLHMPKEAARIFLKVTDVRVNRLQEITAEQCADEGIDIEGMDYGFEAVHEFSQLWDSTIKKADLDRYGWDANPFVWVIEFERCEKEVEEGK